MAKTGRDRKDQSKGRGGSVSICRSWYCCFFIVLHTYVLATGLDWFSLPGGFSFPFFSAAF